MKNNLNYKFIDNFLIIIFCIILLLSILYFFNFKIYKYNTFKGISIEKNRFISFINKKDIKYLYTNKFIYINNIKYSFDFDIDDNFEDLNFYKVNLKINNTNNNEIDNNITFSIFYKKIDIYEIFKCILR